MCNFSLLNQITKRSNAYSIRASRSAMHRWEDLEKDEAAPNESSETSKQPSPFIKFENIQLPFFFPTYQKGHVTEHYLIRSYLKKLP